MSIYGRSRVKVPASTANLGPGFDTLGMALSLYAWIEMEEAAETVFHLYGDEMAGVPRDKSNLLYKVAQMVFAEARVQVPELSISMYSEIPLTRGLGSSATAIIGALAAANAMIGSPLSQAKLFDMATAIEKHPDNVGASLFGELLRPYGTASMPIISGSSRRRSWNSWWSFLNSSWRPSRPERRCLRRLP